MDKVSTGLSIILPVYNDAAAINRFLPELLVFTSRQQQNCEIILVDDGSKDHLTTLFETFRQQLPSNTALRLIQFSRNFGKEAALTAGLAQSQGELVTMMDADGQHPVSVLEQMLELIQTNNVDVVAAVQASREHEGLLTRILKNGFYHFMQDTHRYELTPNAGDFRLMKRYVVEALLKLPERQRFMKGLYAWVGFSTIYIPFQASERQAGKSKFNYFSLFELALIGITSFSQRPLRWISRMGMIISFLSIVYGLCIVADTLFFGKDLAGWPTLAAGIMFSAGIQLVCLGVIGEYIGRIYEEVKQRPLYLVDKVWDSREK
ncbi:glycosyltransferase [Snodgrassella alvi]|uniref:glycosyltransferase family 2 protein n=1 Tax=Snodgrassella alvi TaxID=1196083 RepID=UPI000A00BD45|nr:glycosyltransferase family 2 protein [Snodgrassella alvi]ORF00007.1 glycosyltransferase [Snodgrassella alvi]ORF06746.1 glycosyltransferase [Snodgrassella alvi]ORF10099.1 glycosyltransferase [Snodgrassella alvi]ORF11364.1 glycosyltransferase [Snodgrassella alvi]ORF17589.1 glycosyltransferase [Snodgrassella alvi]